ncbi:MAG: hypothetical protein ACFFDN_18170 [Candidatus Hodarchaeota archaeon]
MRDFTLQYFKSVCNEFKKNGYEFLTFYDYCLGNLSKKFLIMRHDVDRHVIHALKMAEIENSLGVKSTYYFRYQKGDFDNNIIRRIISLGHEVGYHYESLAKARGDFSKAIKIFKLELNRLNEITNVKTICAHGSPLSKWDSKKLWEKYNFEKFEISGEPYFSTDFNEVLYLTDTGRRWDGKNFNVRDKVNSGFDYKFKSTFDIVNALNKNKLPDKLMINIHPHRWNNNYFLWIKELFWQNIKNIGKKVLAN